MLQQFSAKHCKIACLKLWWWSSDSLPLLNSEDRFGGGWVDQNAENPLLFVCGWRPLCLGSPSAHICFPALGGPTKGNTFEEVWFLLIEISWKAGGILKLTHHSSLLELKCSHQSRCAQHRQFQIWKQWLTPLSTCNGRHHGLVVHGYCCRKQRACIK